MVPSEGLMGKELLTQALLSSVSVHHDQDATDLQQQRVLQMAKHLPAVTPKLQEITHIWHRFAWGEPLRAPAGPQLSV